MSIEEIKEELNNCYHTPDEICYIIQDYFSTNELKELQKAAEEYGNSVNEAQEKFIDILKENDLWIEG